MIFPVLNNSCLRFENSSSVNVSDLFVVFGLRWSGPHQTRVICHLRSTTWVVFFYYLWHQWRSGADNGLSVPLSTSKDQTGADNGLSGTSADLVQTMGSMAPVQIWCIQWSLLPGYQSHVTWQGILGLVYQIFDRLHKVSYVFRNVYYGQPRIYI